MKVKKGENHLFEGFSVNLALVGIPLVWRLEQNLLRAWVCLPGSLGIDIGHDSFNPKNRYDIMLEGVAVAEMKSPAGLRRIPRLEYESQSTGLPCSLIHLSH